jgi:hypothetical protein
MLTDWWFVLVVSECRNTQLTDEGKWAVITLSCQPPIHRGPRLVGAVGGGLQLWTGGMRHIGL